MKAPKRTLSLNILFGRFNYLLFVRLLLSERAEPLVSAERVDLLSLLRLLTDEFLLLLLFTVVLLLVLLLLLFTDDLLLLLR